MIRRHSTHLAPLIMQICVDRKQPTISSELAFVLTLASGTNENENLTTTQRCHRKQHALFRNCSLFFSNDHHAHLQERSHDYEQLQNSIEECRKSNPKTECMGRNHRGWG